MSQFRALRWFNGLIGSHEAYVATGVATSSRCADFLFYLGEQRSSRRDDALKYVNADR